MILEKNETNLRFNHQQVLKNLCKQLCPNTCELQINKIGIEDLKEKFVGNSNIIIEPKNFKKYEYISIFQIDIWEYLTNLGGLFGLYLGITIIDLSIFIKFSSIILQKILFIGIKLIRYFKFRILQRYLRKIITFTILFSNIQWKIIFTYISTLILFYQIYNLLNTYFQYNTITTYEFIPYKIIDYKLSIDDFPSLTICYENIFDNIISDDHYDHEVVPFFDKLNFVSPNKSHDPLVEYDDIFRYSYSQLFSENTSISAFYYLDNFNRYCIKIIERIRTMGNHQKYFVLKDYILFYQSLFAVLMQKQYFVSTQNRKELNIKPKYFEMRFLVDFLDNYILNQNSSNESRLLHSGKQGIRDSFRFFNLHHSCNLNISTNVNCDTVKPNINYLSPHGHCITYLSGTKNVNDRVDLIKLINRLLTEGNFMKRPRHFPMYAKKTIFAHDHNTIPLNEKFSFGKIYIPDNKKDYDVEIITTFLKKSPKPYDTQCQDYFQSSQNLCLNGCYLKGYLDKYKCIPTVNKFHITFNENLNETNFCNSVLNVSENFKKIMLANCERNCGKPCEEYIYENDVNMKSENDDIFLEDYFSQNVVFSINKMFYTKINFIPKI